MKQINEVFLKPISEANFSKINKEGIRCNSIIIPTDRCGINEWFNKFSKLCH